MGIHYLPFALELPENKSLDARLILDLIAGFESELFGAVPYGDYEILCDYRVFVVEGQFDCNDGVIKPLM